MEQPTSRNVFEIVTERILTELQKGIVPWKKPWTEAGIPQNAVTRRPYRGINLLLLSTLNYSENYFLTPKQVSELGGTVKKDEKTHIVTFVKWKQDDDAGTGEVKSSPILRYYRVYNITQIEGIPADKRPPTVLKPNKPIESAEIIVTNMPKKPVIKHEEHKAYYHPIEDFVNMPKIEAFRDSESYYNVLFHELVHSTGHLKRLNRKELMQMSEFGSETYSTEELTAEIGACFLNSYAGFKSEDLSYNMAYLRAWMSKLSNDKRCIVYAAAQAQKAVDFIRGVKKEKDEVPDTTVEVPELEHVES